MNDKTEIQKSLGTCPAITWDHLHLDQQIGTQVHSAGNLVSPQDSIKATMSCTFFGDEAIALELNVVTANNVNILNATDL